MNQKLSGIFVSLENSLENLKNIASFTRFFKNRYVQVTFIRKRMELA
jgi:hypothetical protein